MLFSQMATRIIDERLFALHVDVPEFLVGNLYNAVPQILLIHVVFPIFSKIAFEQVIHLR